MKYIRIPGLETYIEVFDDEDDLCEHCSYPCRDRGCHSCSIFHKYRKHSGGIIHFEKNISVGKYYDAAKTRKLKGDPKTGLSKLIIDAKSNETAIGLLVKLLEMRLKNQLSIGIGNKKYFICPIPDHPDSFQKGSILARKLSEYVGIEYIPALTKIKNTQKQHGIKKIQERFDNVKGAFAINPDIVSAIHGRIALLTDDIISTMATQNECSKVLMENGVDKIISLSVGRTILKKEEQ